MKICAALCAGGDEEGSARASGMMRIIPADGRQDEEVQQAVVLSNRGAAVIHPPSPPESDHSDAEESDDDDESSSSDEDFLLAGYEYCSQEAIRYLMEEEKLDGSHPVIQSLQQHLESRRRQVAGTAGHIVTGLPPPARQQPSGAP